MGVFPVETNSFGVNIPGVVSPRKTDGEPA
jgi:hypothetical protein